MARTMIAMLVACFISGVLALPMSVSDRIVALEQQVKIHELLAHGRVKETYGSLMDIVRSCLTRLQHYRGLCVCSVPTRQRHSPHSHDTSSNDSLRLAPGPHRCHAWADGFVWRGCGGEVMWC